MARWPLPLELLLAMDDGDGLAVHAAADWLEERGIQSGWREVARGGYWPAHVEGWWEWVFDGRPSRSKVPEEVCRRIPRPGGLRDQKGYPPAEGVPIPLLHSHQSHALSRLAAGFENLAREGKWK